ncbi:hypothetical protein J4442_00970 [Candidatus Woesearchaeota archaeon]|nr:hypothetical protein [Candidatus Woesearchaeota archaeon]
MTDLNLKDILTAVSGLGVLYMPFVLAYDYVSTNYGRLFHGVSEDLSDTIMEAEDGE